MSDFTLRPVTLADTPRIAELEEQLFPIEAWDLEMLLHEVSHADRRYVAAINPEGILIGYAGIMLLGESADIHTIGTCEPGRGIGQALLNWCEEQAAAAGASELLLEVRVDNTRARAFYTTAGYAELGIRKGYYPSPAGRVDAVVMRKSLAAYKPTAENPAA